MDNIVFAPEDIKEIVSPNMDFLSMMKKMREHDNIGDIYGRREKFRV